MILKKFTKPFFFILIMSAGVNSLKAPKSGLPPEAIGVFAIPVLIHNITEEVSKLQAVIQLLTMAPTPRDMISPDGTMRDVAGEGEGKPVVVKLSEVSGNSTRDAGVPAALLPLQLNAVIEGRIKQLDDLSKKRLEQALDGVQPVIDLVADLKWYVAQTVKVLGTGVALYVAYKCYSSWLQVKKARIAVITNCFSLVTKANSKATTAPLNKKTTALIRRFAQTQGGLFLLNGSQEVTTDMLANLSKLSALAFVPAHILKESFVDSALQKDVIAAMSALQKDNIPLVVLDSDAVLSDVSWLNWIRLSFKPNKIVFVSSEIGAQKLSEHMCKSFVTVTASTASV